MLTFAFYQDVLLKRTYEIATSVLPIYTKPFTVRIILGFLVVVL